jgi:hypothetical protein
MALGDFMNSNDRLDRLEADVLKRIDAHRRMRSARFSLLLGTLLAVTALGSGLWTGVSELQRRTTRPGSEAALLDDDLSLAPSSLLASNQ